MSATTPIQPPVTSGAPPQPGAGDGATAPVAPATANRRRRFVALYRLFLRNQATTSRLLGLGALGVVGIALGLLIGVNHPFDPTRRGTRLVDVYGLSLLAPITSLVFASSALGDLVDDHTLVYVWLRSVPRAHIAWAAAAASTAVCAPLVVVPLVIAAALTGGDATLLSGAAVSSLVAVIGYVGVFTAVGLRFRRALVWGIVYILLWEQFVARAAGSASKLALLAYSRSVLSGYTGVGLKLATLSVPVGLVVPLVVGPLAVVYTGRRLAHHDVD